MKNNIYLLAIVCLLVGNLSAQDSISISAKVQYPEFTDVGIGYAINHTKANLAASSGSEMPFYVLEKQDWKRGEVYQLEITAETVDIDTFYCYHFSETKGIAQGLEEEPYKIVTGLVTIPGAHNGFALEDKAEGDEKICFLFSKDKIEFKPFSAEKKELSFMENLLNLLPSNIDSKNANSKGLKGVLTKEHPILPLFINFNTNREKATRGNTLHAVLFGPAFRNLEFTGQDINDVENFLKSDNIKKSFTEVSIRAYTDSLSTTKETIEREITRLKDLYIEGDISADDMIMIYISSQGFTEQDELFIQASNTKITEPLSTSLNYTEIYQDLKTIPCVKMMFLDASASPVDWTAEPVVYSPDSPIRPIMEERIYTVLSNSALEYSYESPEWQNGAFTEAWLEGMNGAADVNGDGWIYFGELYAYLSDRTRELVKDVYGKKQTPVLPRAGYVDIPLVKTSDFRWRK